MKTKIYNIDCKPVKDISLDKDIFGLDVRVDIIKRVVDWQLLARMSGNHSTKNVGEVSGSTKKPFKQKGTGNARQGNARGVQRRGGGKAHSIDPRSHAIKLNKKIRVQGLKHALSAKMQEKCLFIVDEFVLDKIKTSVMQEKLSKFGEGKTFMIDGDSVDTNVKLSTKSVKGANIVPCIGANVYDIVNSDYVLISQNGLKALKSRLNDK